MFQKLSGSEFFINKGGVVSRFSVEKFFSHSAEKIRRATLLCSSQKLSGSEKLQWIKGGGEYQDFPSKNFSLTVPKKFVGQLCCAVFQKCAGSEKVNG